MTARITDFKNFMADIVDLNETRMTLLRDRVDAVEDFLLASETLSDCIDGDLIPQGSFAHKTIIRPRPDGEYDADVLVPMAEVEGWEPKKYTETLHAALEIGRYERKSVLRKRCVRLDYADGFHIDLVPFVELSNNETYITHRTKNEFIRQDPTEYTEWFRGQHRNANWHLIRAVRLAKWLRDGSSAEVPSVVLAALMAERVHGFAGTSDYSSVPVTFVTVITALDDYLDGLVSPPWVDDRIGQNLADRWTQSAFDVFKSQLHTWRRKANTALNEEDPTASVDAWRLLFGPKFGDPVQKSESSNSSTSGRRAVAPGEQDLTADFNIPIRISPLHQVSIVGRFAATTRGRGRARPMSAHGNHVPVGRRLTFEVNGCTVPEPYDIYWKVRNDGAEAASLNNYRGDITKGTQTLTEHSSFAGPHWVQVWIVKNGIAVATDVCDVTILPHRLAGNSIAV